LLTGNKGKVVFDLAKYQTQDGVVRAMGKLPFLGENTNTSGGLYLASQLLTESKYGARFAVPKIIILITDGNPNVDAHLLAAEVARIKSLNIRIVCITITTQVSCLP